MQISVCATDSLPAQPTRYLRKRFAAFANDSLPAQPMRNQLAACANDSLPEQPMHNRFAACATDAQLIHSCSVALETLTSAFASETHNQRTNQREPAATALLNASLFLSALDSSHLLLRKPDRTVVFSVVRGGTAVIAQVSAGCFQCRHAVRRARVTALADNGI